MTAPGTLVEVTTQVASHGEAIRQCWRSASQAGRLHLVTVAPHKRTLGAAIAVDEHDDVPVESGIADRPGQDDPAAHVREECVR